MIYSLVQQQKTEVTRDKNDDVQKQSSLLELHIAEMEALKATKERNKCPLCKQKKEC